MIDLKDLRNHPDRYRDAARHKRIEVDIDRLLALDEQHRGLLTQRQRIAAEINKIGKQIGEMAGRLKKTSDDDRPALQQNMRQLQARPSQLKEEEHALESRIAQLQPELDQLLSRVPQPPDDGVPIGRDDTDNVEIRKWGQVRQFDFQPKDHVTLGTELGMIDIERGVRLAGTRNYFLVGQGALLHHAVIVGSPYPPNA